MRRREFVAIVSGAVAWPLSGRAQAQQSSQSYRIAFVSPYLPGDMTEKGDHAGFRALCAELRRLGYIEDHNLVVERYSTSGLKEPF
jgi:putative tryptophan/tyrosine transport system substrate-binding protein